MSFCCHSSGLGEQAAGAKGYWKYWVLSGDDDGSENLMYSKILTRSTSQISVRVQTLSIWARSYQASSTGHLAEAGQDNNVAKKKNHKATYFWKSLKHFYNTECKINSRVEEKWWWITQFQAFKIWQFWATRNRDYKIKRMWHLGSITIGFAYVV